jgi:hypothetical protein
LCGDARNNQLQPFFKLSIEVREKLPGLEREREFFSNECSSLTPKKGMALYQGTALRLAEKLMFLKGTAYPAAASIRPYLSALR